MKSSKPKKRLWIFCPEMTLAQFPKFGFFVQNSRIGDNGTDKKVDRSQILFLKNVIWNLSSSSEMIIHQFDGNFSDILPVNSSSQFMSAYFE